MAEVHSSSVVAPEAVLADTVKIGPFCVVGPSVELGEDVVLHSHVVVEGRTSIGARTQIFPFASIGHQPQDLKFGGEESTVSIGSDNIIREHVTINPGTKGGHMKTVVGNGCMLMVGAHVAHDCILGDHVILVNNATLGGHVVIGENTIVGGLAAIHQFVRVGRDAMIGGMSGVENDVIPYGMVTGERASLNGLNLIGMKRRGHERSAIVELQDAYKKLFSETGNFADRLDEFNADESDSAPVRDVLTFIQGESSRGLLHPKKK
ncbi:acyl-ACP--UDP-N-acetylglucosamine O-acyltransferase [Pelagibius sp. Alg239-R121]|uniref:acyl-ACP--UDP-N-acetylglucosamine O-acyltransferase n=1 Tax=Pelagibius sp. Alg239-R121 TaxID=2993448 RepID=UPI0024A7916D|nr:acyl-ACP--UDP-N-acetylglucosamine O-acyltransferase [Pelagibius sp. Alg239-R121]